jgi:hypothetical protein
LATPILAQVAALEISMTTSRPVRRVALLVGALALVVAACGEDASDSSTTAAAVSSTTSEAETPATTSAPASAEGAAVGDAVSVHYIGTLPDGTEFE